MSCIKNFRHVSGGNYLTGQVEYMAEPSSNEHVFSRRYDAVLGYFQYQTTKVTKGSIGFSKS